MLTSRPEWFDGNTMIIYLSGRMEARVVSNVAVYVSILLMFLPMSLGW